MTFALCLQLPNHIRFKRPVDIYANFIPQMIFLQSIFGYLVLCIIYKWSVDWSKSSTAPPSLLNMLIDMFLSPGTVDPATQLYPGQSVVQVVLLGLAGICVPWLLCLKPYIQWKEMQKIQAQGYVGLRHDGHPGDEELAGEEEGNGRAIAEDAEEEHVRRSVAPSSSLIAVSLFEGFCVLTALISCRRATTSAR
jgi:V-type H+-transporting ATPase subunit a